jgi:hypothetical protein
MYVSNSRWTLPIDLPSRNLQKRISLQFKASINPGLDRERKITASLSRKVQQNHLVACELDMCVELYSYMHMHCKMDLLSMDASLCLASSIPQDISLCNKIHAFFLSKLQIECTVNGIKCIMYIAPNLLSSGLQSSQSPA